MKFRFIGDPRNGFSGPDEFEKFGLRFSRTDWTEVADQSVIARLLGSSHYENGGAFAEPEPAPMTHTVTTGIVGTASDERDALIRDAESLGIAVDRRWSNATLAVKISQALSA